MAMGGVTKSFVGLVFSFSVAGCGSDPPPDSVAKKTRLAITTFEEAVSTKIRIKSTEERVFESLAKIDQLTEQYDPRDLKTEELLLDEYREQVLPRMLQWSKKISAAKAEFSRDWKTHIDAVKAAPEIFRQCKNEYLIWADTQDDDEFRAIYKDMAEASESWAKAMERRSVTLAKMHDEFVLKTKLIDDSVVFLQRLESFLKTIPDASRAAELQEFMEEVERYIEAFQRTVHSFKNFSDKLKSDEYLESKDLTWQHSLLRESGCV